MSITQKYTESWNKKMSKRARTKYGIMNHETRQGIKEQDTAS
jgi:CRISPR/Cas system CMR-associated protein Cmr1 (group 7 of RAMP superfamily)